MKIGLILVTFGIVVSFGQPFARAASMTDDPKSMALKMVRYREAVTFPIPASWIEEDEPGIQGVFYEDGPDTGTLRVSVMQWDGETEEERNSMIKSILFPGEVETLKKGIYLKREVKPGWESGEALSLHRWLVALALPSNIFRLVVFTHCVTAAQESEAATITELKTVDFSVRNAVFSVELELPLIDQP